MTFELILNYFGNCTTPLTVCINWVNLTSSDVEIYIHLLDLTRNRCEKCKESLVGIEPETKL